LLYQAFGGIQLSQRQLVMVFVIESIAQIGVKGMNIIEPGEILNDISQTFRDGLLREFDLSHAEISRLR